MIKINLFGGQIDNDELQFQRLAKLFDSDNRELDSLSKSKASPLEELPLIEGKYEGGDDDWNLSFSSSLEIEVVNRKNPFHAMIPRNHPMGIEKDLAAKEEEKYEWSYGNADTAVIYRLIGEVNGGLDTKSIPLGAGAQASLGFQGGSKAAASYIVIHNDDPTVSEALRHDLEAGHGFLFSRNPRAIHELKADQEFLMTEIEGGFHFSTNLAWGQVFQTNPGLVGSVFSDSPYLSNPTGAGSLDLAKVGMEAEVHLGARIGSRMEVVAWKTTKKKEGSERDVVRVEVRKASNRNSNLGGSLNITANILDSDSARKALAELILSRVDVVGETLGGIESELLQFRSRIEQKWSQLTLRDDIFSDADAAVKDALEKAETIFEEKLGVSLRELLGLEDRMAAITGQLEKISGKLNVETKVNAWMDELVEKAAGLSTDDLPEHWKAIVSVLAGNQGYEELSPVSLASLLGIPEFRKKAIEKVGDPDFQLVDAEILRAELLRLIDGQVLSVLQDSSGKTLFDLLEEATGFGFAEILADFSSRELLAQLLPEDAPLTIEDLFAGLSEFVFGDDFVLSDLEKNLIKWLGGAAENWDQKLDAAVHRIANAIPREVELSASFELERKKENEALLSFDFDMELPDSGELIEGLYAELLRGNLDPALTLYREEEAKIGQGIMNPAEAHFVAIDFYAVEKFEKRQSFQLRILDNLYTQEGITSGWTLENLQGNVQHHYLVEALWREKWGDRDWSGYTRLSAESTRFLSRGSEAAVDFDFRLQCGVSCGGEVHPNEDDKFDTGRQNWLMINALANVFDSKRRSSAKVSSLLAEIEGEIGDSGDVQLDLHLSIDPGLMPSLWKAAPKKTGLASVKKGKDGKLADLYIEEWAKLKVARNPNGNEIKYGLDGNERPNFSFYFRSFAKLAKQAKSTTPNLDELYTKMRKWRIRTNVNGSQPDKLDKIAYLVAFIAWLPEKRAGWTLGATVTQGEKKVYLG